MWRGVPNDGLPSTSYGAKGAAVGTDTLRCSSGSTMANSPCRSTVADSCDDRPEGSFNSQYDIEDATAILGHGAFSAVRVVATRRKNGRKYEAKVVKRSELPDSGLATLRREVALLQELHHPNIVRLLGWYEEDVSHLYMVFELCEGGDLLDFIGSKTTYNEKEPRDVVLKLLETVKYMHDRGIVHRDLQPRNLLLANRDTATFKIADFGRATEGDAPSDLCPRRCGSREYMSPEEIEKKPCGPAVDMWSIGVISYILVAGEAPFKDSCQVRLVAKIKSGNVTFDEEVWGPISDCAQDLIQRMLTVDPVERITADGALDHPWFNNVPDFKLMRSDLGPSLKRLHVFNALRKFKAAVMLMVLASMQLGPYAGIKQSEEMHEGAPSNACEYGGGVSEACLAPDIDKALEPSSCGQEHGQMSPSRSPDGSCGGRDRLSPRLPDHNDSVHLEPVEGTPPRGCSSDDPEVFSPEPRVTLAHVLTPGKQYESVSHGVRLTVQPNSLPDEPQAGPIQLEDTTQIVPCEGEEYFVDVLVRCKPSGISFKEPLLLDFYIDDGPSKDCPEVSLDEILTDNQVATLRTPRGTHPIPSFQLEPSADDRIRLPSLGVASWQHSGRKKYDPVDPLLKVLRDDGCGGWCTMPKEQLSLEFDEDGSILLRAHVDHFCVFTCGGRGGGSNRIRSGKQRDKRVVVMKNATGACRRGRSSTIRRLSRSKSELRGDTNQKQSEGGVQNIEGDQCQDRVKDWGGEERRVSGDKMVDGGMDLLVVTVPIEYESNRNEQRNVSVNLGYAGVGVGVGFEGQGETERYLLPGGTSPFCSSLLRGDTQSFVVGQQGQNVRFLICSLEDCVSLSDWTSNVTDSGGSSGTPSDVTTGGNDEQMMRLWDNLNAYGGQKLALLPRFVEGTRQKFAIVNKQEVVLADVAMALAGMGERVGQPAGQRASQPVGQPSSRSGVRGSVVLGLRSAMTRLLGRDHQSG